MKLSEDNIDYHSSNDEIPEEKNRGKVPQGPRAGSAFLARISYFSRNQYNTKSNKIFYKGDF